MTHIVQALSAIVKHQHEGVENVAGFAGSVALAFRHQPVHDLTQLQTLEQLAYDRKTGPRGQSVLR
ncbi:MAG: hypothetical protein F4082_05665 [Gammaproteobacteria bacterium]|nr:hypothetical protein [Gammaproteobacteria bacterium]